MLVFQITSSVALAGFVLFIEWMPKLGLYLVGGSIAQRFGFARAHLGLDCARMAALAGLLACASGYGSWWLVAASAAVYQCANAVSSILFENYVTRWWAPGERAIGHASLIKSDLWGCLLALGAGLALGSPWRLALAGLVIQAGCLALVVRSRLGLCPEGYDALAGASDPIPLTQQLRLDARAAGREVLLKFAASCTLLAVPAATIVSTLVFYLDRAQSGAADNAHWLSVLLLVRTALALGVLQFTQARLRRGVSERTFANFGMGLLLVSASVLALPLPLWAMVTAAVALGVSGIFYLPLLRHQRQELIALCVQEHSRAGVTGILISMEACAYLVAAGLLGLFGQDLGALSLGAAMLALAGVVLLRAVRKPEPSAAAPSVS